MSEHEMRVGCDVLPRADGEFDIVITIGPAPVQVVQALINALHDPIKSAIVATLDCRAGETVHTRSSAARN